MKPANILLEISVEKVMLTDFGLARAIDDASITRTGIIAGTPLYMSPEQARGEPVDARSDLFSLGTVLYTLATGRTPFRAESTYGILRRLTDESPRPLREISPQFPAWFEMIVHKLLARVPPIDSPVRRRLLSYWKAVWLTSNNRGRCRCPLSVLLFRLDDLCGDGRY